MTLRVGEVGKTIRADCNFDLSSYSELTLKFTKPDGTTVSKTTADGVTAPGSEVTDSDGNVFSASEYMEYDFESGVLDQSGQWTVQPIYNDAVPKTFKGEPKTFSVLE